MTDSEWIVVIPGTLAGKPCVRGTRLSVAFVLELVASGASRDDILKTYPQLTAEGLEAALRYAAEALDHEVVWDAKIPA